MQTDFGVRLREERGRLGLTQAGAATALGMPAVTYRTYESGRSEPPLSAFQKMANAGMDAHYIASGLRQLEVLDSHVDWQLLMELAGLISAWSSKRQRPLDLSEQANYLRLALGLAASRDAATARQVLDRLLQAA